MRSPFALDLTTDQRLDQIAAILAAAVLRLRDRAAIPGAGAKTPEFSAAGPLEVPDGTVLSVHTG